MHFTKSYRFLGLSAAAAMLVGASNPQNAIMDRIEQTIKMPDGASDLSSYVRTYAFVEDKRVIGIYERLRTNQEVARRTWVDRKRLPSISGGGCGVVTVFYDPIKKAASSGMCNPVE